MGISMPKRKSQEKRDLSRRVSSGTPLHGRILKRERRIRQLSDVTPTQRIQKKIEILKAEIDELSGAVTLRGKPDKSHYKFAPTKRCGRGESAISTTSTEQHPMPAVTLTTPQGFTWVWSFSLD